MAFTAGEFVRGAFVAWLAFLAFASVAMSLLVLVAAVAEGDPAELSYIPAVLMLTPLTAATPSLVLLLLLGSPMAFMLCTALRSVPQLWTHRLALGALGCAVGLVGVVAWSIGQDLPTPGVSGSYAAAPPYWERVDWLLAAVLAPATGLATSYGWMSTMKRGLRRDAGFSSSVCAPRSRR